jgi:hypothetical protein
MYELKDTTAENDLARAASRGVNVPVILDRHLEKSANTAAYGYLKDHGVHVAWAPAGTTYHQTTLTVDGKTSLIMTLNMVSSDYAGTRDFAALDTSGPDATSALEAAAKRGVDGKRRICAFGARATGKNSGHEPHREGAHRDSRHGGACRGRGGVHGRRNPGEPVGSQRELCLQRGIQALSAGGPALPDDHPGQRQFRCGPVEGNLGQHVGGDADQRHRPLSRRHWHQPGPGYL